MLHMSAAGLGADEASSGEGAGAVCVLYPAGGGAMEQDDGVRDGADATGARAVPDR